MSSPRIGCLLLPGFSLATLAGAVDTLAAAVALQPGQVGEPLLLSLDGRPVRSNAGAWVVAGGALGGLGTGAAWLAEAGLLAGHRATLHWPHLAALAERHPQVVLSQQRFEIDRGRLSSAGGEAARDLMIAWLGQHHGERLAQELAAQCGLGSPRLAEERQRVPTPGRGGTGSDKLAEALALMEANLAEPLPTEEVARLVGVSRRHLARLFRPHLDALPSRWYLGLRLERARALLRQTPQSILQIGLACGFASGPHFSNAYRAHFGRTPRDERGARASAWQSAPAALPQAERED